MAGVGSDDLSPLVMAGAMGDGWRGTCRFKGAYGDLAQAAEDGFITPETVATVMIQFFDSNVIIQNYKNGLVTPETVSTRMMLPCFWV